MIVTTGSLRRHRCWPAQRRCWPTHSASSAPGFFGFARRFGSGRAPGHAWRPPPASSPPASAAKPWTPVRASASPDRSARVPARKQRTISRRADGRAHLSLRHHPARWRRRPRASTSPSPTRCAIARMLDQLGIDYVEGGWPGANPTDDGFFADPPALRARQAVRVRHDPARRPQRRQRPRPRRAVPEQDRRHHPGRQELGPAGRGGARRRAGREPAHDRGQRRARRAGACRRGDVRRRALLRRLRGRSGLRARLPRGGPRRAARAGSCCATPTAAACRTRSERGRGAGRAAHPARPARHPHPQRHRERGRQHAGRGARRRAPGAGHAERPRRALRQRQPGQPDPDADAEAGLRDGRVAKPACAISPSCRAPFDERLNRIPEPARRLCRRLRLRPQGGPARLGGGQGPEPATSTSDPRLVGNARHVAGLGPGRAAPTC